MRKTIAMRVAQLGLIMAAGAAVSGCADMGQKKLAVVAPCADVNFQIYFDEQSASITRAARGVIAGATRHERGCRVTAVDVIGLADYKGPADANLALSRRRAEAVAKVLSARGLPAPTFRLEAAGKAGAVTAAGEAEPLRRRADVVIHRAVG